MICVKRVNLCKVWKVLELSFLLEEQIVKVFYYNKDKQKLKEYVWSSYHLVNGKTKGK